MAYIPPTSGTVATYFFPQRKILDQAFRRAGYTPEQVSPEWIGAAQDELFMQLSEYANAGFPLWTRQFGLIGITAGSPEASLPFGTVDVLHAYWRILNPWRGAATLPSGADASVLFGGQPNADVTIPSPAFVQVNFGSPIEIDTIGVLPGAAAAPFLVDGYGNPITDGYGNVIPTGAPVPSPVTASPFLTSSTDGITWYPLQTLPSATYTPGQWTYFDLDPTIVTQYLRINWPVGSSWTVNQLQFAASLGEDIEIGPLNIDDYYNLPDKLFQSDRVVSAYNDRQIAAPVLKLWPVPSQAAFYNGTVSVLSRRYIQDPGVMTDNIEVPIRWYNGVVSRLGIRLMDTLPDPEGSAPASYFTLMAKQQRRQNLLAEATKGEALMFAEERVRAPIRLAPNLRCYTQ